MLIIDRARDLSSLVDILVDRLSSFATAELLPTFDPIACPNGAIEDYIRREATRRSGITAGLVVDRLEGRLERLLAHNAEPIMTRSSLFAAILALFSDPGAAADEDIAPLLSYLDSARTEIGKRKRRIATADDLTRLFLEYARSRPNWPNDADMSRDGSARSTPERFQRAVWRFISRPDAKGYSRLGRPLVAALLHPNSPLPSGKRLHIFGFPAVAQGIGDVIERIAKANDVFVYVLGVPEDGTAAARRERLSRCFAPSAQSIDALVRRADAKIVDHGSAVSGSTLLARAKSAMEGKPLDESGIARDDTFYLIGAANPRRAVEACFEDALRRMAESEKDPASVLLPTDFACLFPPHRKDEFAAHFLSAAADFPGLRVTIDAADRSADGEYVDGIHALLELFESTFERQKVLVLLRHPALARRFPDFDVAAAERFIEKTGIIRDPGKETRSVRYVDKNIWNWDQGLERLSLAAFCDKTDVASDVARTLPHLEDDRLAAAGTTALIVRSLIADVASFKDGGRKLPLAQWMTLIENRIAAYLDFGDKRSGAETRFLLETEALRRRSPDNLSVDFSEAIAVCLGALERARAADSGIPRRLSGGVVVARADAVLGIPFRVVYFLGADDGNFPARSSPHPFDLRGPTRLPGDLLAEDADLLAFGQALRSAKDAFVVVFTARDPLTGESLPPAPIVEEIAEAAEKKGAVDRLLLRHPLRRFDAAYFGDASPAKSPPRSPAAHRERKAVLLRTALGIGRNIDADWPKRTLARLVSSEGFSAVARFLELPPNEQKGIVDDREKIELSISRIQKFFDSPLDAWLRQQFEFEDDAIETNDDDEPLGASRMDAAMLLRRLAETRIAEPGGTRAETTSAYERQVDDLEREARWPSGPFRESQRLDHQSTIDRWFEDLSAQTSLPPCRPLLFGQEPQAADVALMLPPIRLTLDGPSPTKARTILVVGRTAPISAGGDVIVLPVRKSSGLRDFILGFLTMTLACAAGKVSAKRVKVIALIGATDPKKSWRSVELPTLERSAATALLCEWAHQLLDLEHDYLLPLTAIERIAPKLADDDLDEVVEDAVLHALATEERTGISGVVRDRDRFRIPDAEFVKTVVASRFAPILSFYDAREE